MRVTSEDDYMAEHAEWMHRPAVRDGSRFWLLAGVLFGVAVWMYRRWF